MNAIIAYILARLGEASTYRGIFALLTALGISMNPEQASAITATGLALIGMVNVLKKDAVVKGLPLLFACLLLPSCATDAQGGKTFLGIDAAGWANTGKAALVSAVPVALDERAKRSAKNPVKVQP
jgi:hypothetical protein